MAPTRVTRRSLLKAGTIAGAGLAVPWRWLADAPDAQTASQGGRLRNFIQPLRNPVLGGIPIVVDPWMAEVNPHSLRPSTR
jgi:hypothetical protein